MRFVAALCMAVTLNFCHAQVPSLKPMNGVFPAVLNSAGGTYDNPTSYFRYEWSFGEMVMIESYSNNDSTLILTQGVLQPCLDKNGVYPLTILFEADDYRLFPNPTSGKFELNFFVRSPGRMSLRLINSTGTTLERRSYYYNGCCRIELFDLSRYPNGIYYVVADLEADEIRVQDKIQVTRHGGFKVIKIN